MVSQQTRKIRIAFAGGGRRIGKAHQIAALMDNRAELVAGCFSRDTETNSAIGRELFVPESRTYRSIEELIAGEAKREPGDRADAITVITPDGGHFPMAKAALDAGFHVICEKPMTCTREQAEALVKQVEESGLVFALTHNYTGNLLVRQVREMVKAGELGAVSRVVVEYLQGGDHIRIPEGPDPFDPEQFSAGGSIANIGTHAFNLLEYITGDRVISLCCDSIDVSARCPTPRDGAMLLRMAGGAKASLLCSQMAPGEANELNFRLYAAEGAVEWHQNRPETMRLTRRGNPNRTVWRGHDMPEDVREQMRAWPAHPEGYLEAFGNVYLGAYDAIAAHLAGTPLPIKDYACPTVHDGLRTIRFVDAALESSRQGAGWVVL